MGKCSGNSERPFFNSSNDIPSEKKKNSTCPSCPSNLSRIFPVRKNPKNKSKKKSEKSPEPSPGAPGRRALLLLHFFGGLLGHLQVRLEAGFGDFLVDYDGL